jgi:hypothetical protein
MMAAYDSKWLSDKLDSMGRRGETRLAEGMGY